MFYYLYACCKNDLRNRNFTADITRFVSILILKSHFQLFSAFRLLFLSNVMVACAAIGQDTLYDWN